MKYISLLSILLLTIQSIFSQNINGKVIDSLGNSIPFATIQLLTKENNKVISFTQSNSEGIFNLKTIEQSFPLKIKVSHISFDPFENIITSNDFLEIQLNPRINKLQDVVIEETVFDVQEKPDTLNYNLKRLLNGSELLLKDVIEKLPGLSIDANGKIRYNGSTIDHLLLDGDEFFKENHQIATENLTAEMIEKIVLLKNYQDFSSLKGFENSGKTALNINLKGEYKEQYKGTASSEIGIKKRYELNNNLYNFGSKIKFNLLTNSNNLNKTIFSLSDYLEIRNATGKKIIEDQFSSGSFSATEKDLPPFLFSTDNINTKDLQNANLHFTKKLNNKERIEFITIFNNINQTEKNESFQTFFNDSNSNIINNESIRGKSFYNSTVFKYENKLNTDTYFKVNTYLFNSSDSQNQNLSNFLFANETVNFFDNASKLHSTKFGLNTYLKNKLSSKILLESTFYYDYMNSNSTKNFDSNLIFDWFEYDKNSFNLSYKANWMTLGLHNKATYKLKKGAVTLKLLSSLENETFKSNNSIGNVFNFTDTYHSTENNLDVKYNYYFFKDKLSFVAGLNLSNNNYVLSSKFNEKINVVLPNISLAYRLIKNLSLSSSFRTSLGKFSILNFLNNPIIENYRTQTLGNKLIPEKVLSNIYSTNLSYSNIKKNVYTSLSISYNKNPRLVGKTFNNTVFVTNQQFNYLENQESSSLIYNFEKKFYSIPYGVNFSSINTRIENNSFINDEMSKNEIYQNQANFNLKSYYKKSFFNFNLGITYLSSSTTNETISYKSKGKLVNLNPFLDLNGTLMNKKLNWSVNSSYYVYNSNLLLSNKIFDLGFNTSYNFNESLKLYLHSDNILNIRDNNFKNAIMTNQVFVQQTIMNTLSGFINLGFSYTY